MGAPAVLVSGGSGFIGSNLLDALVRTSARVRVLDLRPAPVCRRVAAADLDAVEFLVGNIRDQAACRRAVEGMDAVVHLAAESGIPSSVRDPAGNFAVNVEGTLRLLLATRDAGVRRFLFASSGAVLGRHAPPGDEATPTAPVSPYGAAKLAAEAYCLAFGETYGLATTVLRFSNVYGPGSAHKRSVVAKFCKRALRDEPLVIFGDGRQTRDFLYVDDLTDALRLCLGQPRATGIFQLGSGVPVSVLEVADAVRELARRDCGGDLSIQFEPARPFEVRDSYYRVDRARKVLGFAPSTNLKRGMEETWRWFQENASGWELAHGSSE